MSPISFIEIKNISGPNTVPCGTPDFTGVHTEVESSTTTHWFLRVSQDSMYDFEYHKMIIWVEIAGVKLCQMPLGNLKV